MKNINSFLALIILIFITFQIGCTGVSIKQEDKNSIQEVTVDKAILPDEPYYYGPEYSAAAVLGGAVGALITSQVDSKPEQIAQFLKTNNIDVANIVSTEFKNQLEANPFFSGKIKDSAKAHFHLKVEVYGIVQDAPFSSTYKPILRINAQLIDASKGVVWEKVDDVSASSDETPSAEFEKFFQSPDAFRNAFTKASKIIVSTLLGEF